MTPNVQSTIASASQTHRFRDAVAEEFGLQFRLTYEGPLDTQDSPGRVFQKHEIRRQLHPQLRQLWSITPFLKRNLNYFSQQYVRDGFRFIPLVGSQHGRFCALDVLLLRCDMPGFLVSNGGDIDNRIKVLFDALRMTTHKNELAGAVPTADEDPFFVLLEDDRLITEFRVTTDHLLRPSSSGKLNDVLLVINVRTGAIDSDDNFGG